jgi:hypothetical protein
MVAAMGEKGFLIAPARYSVSPGSDLKDAMDRLRSQAAKARCRPSGLAAWLFALVVALPAMVLQVHVHLSDVAPAASAYGHSHAPVAPDKTAPIDPEHCLICQQIAATGSGVVPVQLEARPALRAEAVSHVAQSAVRVQPRASHHWTSRGPPRQA